MRSLPPDRNSPLGLGQKLLLAAAILATALFAFALAHDRAAGQQATHPAHASPAK